MPPVNPLTGLGGGSRKPPAVDDALALIPLLTGGAPTPIPTTGGFLFGPEERALLHKITTDATDYNARQTQLAVGLAAMAEEGKRRREQAAAARGYAATLPGATAAQTDFLASDPAALRTRSEQMGAAFAPPTQYQTGQLALGERRAAATERQADIAAGSASSLDAYRNTLAGIAALRESRLTETDAKRRRKLDLETAKLEKELSRTGGELFPGKDGWERSANDILSRTPAGEQRAALKTALSEQRLTKPTLTTVPDPVTGLPTAATLSPVDLGAAQTRAAQLLSATPDAPAAPAESAGLRGVTLIGERVNEATRKSRTLADSSLSALRRLRRELPSGAYPALSTVLGRLPVEKARTLNALMEQAAAAVTQDLYARNVTGPELERRRAAMIIRPGDPAAVVNAKLAFLEHATEGLAAPNRAGAGADAESAVVAKAKALIEQGMSAEAAYEAAKASVVGR